MIKAFTVYLVYYELKSATINDSINQSITLVLVCFCTLECISDICGFLQVTS